MAPPPPNTAATFRPGQFWAALALVASVFPLIWMGGLVTSHGVGLSVPDWPNSYGYNMFLFPPSQWLGGIFYEHTHRLLGTLSGLLSILLMLMAWGPAKTRNGRIGWAIATLILWLMTGAAGAFAWQAARASTLKPETIRLLPHLAVGLGSLALVATLAWRCRWSDRRRWVRWLSVGVVVAVCVQGTFGGLRVEKVSLTLAIIHGCFAQFFFCLAAFTALVMSRWWRDAPSRLQSPERNAGRMATGLAVITTLMIFTQLIAGALMRHNGAGLAIPGVLNYGHVLPPSDLIGLEAANAARAWSNERELRPVTLTQIWLHFSHRIGAAGVTACVLVSVGYVFQKLGSRGLKRAGGRAAAILPSLILLALLVTQVTLGVLTVYLRKPADIASLHVAVGALTLMTASQVAAVLARQYGRWPVRSAAAAAAESASAGSRVTMA